MRIILFYFLFISNCFAQTITKDINSQIYRTNLDGDEVIIGDKNAAVLKPQIKWTRWNNENFLSISPIDIPFLNPTFSLKTDTLRIDETDIGFYISKSGPDDLKFGLIFKQKPLQNSWSFQLTGWEEFNFYYQAPLKNTYPDGSTWEDSGQGKSIRPASMSGGYAVYHKSKRDNLQGGTPYMTGKFCDFHRPKFIDANGNWVWGNLNITNGIYTISAPQTFLDAAIYPVKVNDQFGKNTKGATSYGNYINGLFNGTIFTNAPAGQITKAYVAAVYSWQTGQLVKAAIYDNSNNLIANTNSGDMTVASTAITTLADWAQATISSGYTLVSGTTYRLAWIANGSDTWMYYDVGGANISSDYQPQSYSAFPSDPAPTSSWTGTAIWSVCYEYTAASARRFFNFE